MTKTKKTTAKALQAKSDASLLRTLAKESSKMRVALAELLGSHERLLADEAKREARVKECEAKVKRLFADPIYAVPSELKLKVEALEARQSNVLTKMTAKASQDDVDGLAASIRILERQRDESDATVGDLHDRVVLLEDSATSPRADPPEPGVAPSDPRQTTLDQAIARAQKMAERDQDNDERAEATEADLAEAQEGLK